MKKNRIKALSDGGGVDYFRKGVRDNQNEAPEPVMWMHNWGEHCTRKGKTLTGIFLEILETVKRKIWPIQTYREDHGKG